MSTLSSRPTRLQDFHSPRGPWTLVSAVSYEKRGFISLQRAVDKFAINRAIILLLNVVDYLDDRTLLTWKGERSKTEAFMRDRGVTTEFVSAKDDDFGEVFDIVSGEARRGGKVVVDMTTLPRNYILGSCKALDGFGVVFQYTLADRYAAPSEMERRTGVSRIQSVDGFEGRIRVNEPAVYVLALGFEGNRALALADEFHGGRVVGLVGSPGFGLPNPDCRDAEFVDNVTSSNRDLLNNSFVEVQHVNSMYPQLFADQLRAVVERQLTSVPKANVVLVPLGTKAQTLGMYLYWRTARSAQILYAVPNRRPSIAMEVGETMLYRIPPQ